MSPSQLREAPKQGQAKSPRGWGVGKGPCREAGGLMTALRRARHRPASEKLETAQMPIRAGTVESAEARAATREPPISCQSAAVLTDAHKSLI